MYASKYHKWIKINSPLDWDKYCNPSKINIKTITKHENLNIFQKTEDSFLCSIIYETEYGKWEYKYDYGVSNKKNGYFLRGNKVSYYDSKSLKNNKESGFGSYNESD